MVGTTRRQFLAAGAGAVAGVQAERSDGIREVAPILRDGREDRTYWVSVMERLVSPVLENLAQGMLKAR